MLLAIVVLFSGELVWRERSARAHTTSDALPVPTGAIVVGKIAALFGLLLTTALAFLVVTAAFQRAHGVERAELSALVVGTALHTWPFLLFGILAVAVHVFERDRWLGHVVVVALVVARILTRSAGFEGELYSFPGSSPPTFSDIDGWGHELVPFLWVEVYWSSAAALLLVFAWVLWPRGDSPARWTRSATLALACCAVLTRTRAASSSTASMC
ncbi:MAG: hypothetical protein GY711_33735 [bacterium]|nr:hypothetical protein [bacterium]